MNAQSQNPSQNPGAQGQNPQNMVFSPPISTSGFSPNMNNSPTPPPAPWVPDYSFGEGSNEYLAGGMTPFADLNQYGMGMGMGGMPVSAMSPLNTNTFQQPPMAPDFWQTPMTIEYDWASMMGAGDYEGFENGMLGDVNGNGHGNGNGNGQG